MLKEHLKMLKQHQSVKFDKIFLGVDNIASNLSLINESQKCLWISESNECFWISESNECFWISESNE